MLQLIVLILLTLLVLLLLIALPLALAIGIGWILTRILPFTLFEGSVLGFLAVITAAPLALRFFRFISSGPDFDAQLTDEELEQLLEDEIWDEEEEDEIPPERFFDGAPTWGEFFHYIIANEIYSAFRDSPRTMKPMNERQQQELAIRLGEIAVEVLRKKPPSTRRLRITQKQIEQALERQGQQPYAADIMELVTDALADILEIYQDELLSVIRERAWDRINPLDY